MRHLSNFVFILMANGSLVRRDSYLNHLVRSGIKQDTLNALTQDENKGYSGSFSHKGYYPPYAKSSSGPTGQHGRVSAMVTTIKVRVSPTTPDRLRVSHHINDNYCIAPVYVTLLTGSQETLEDCQTLNVNSFVADHVPFVVGHPQKKGLSPIIVKQIKCVNGVSFVD